MAPFPALPPPPPHTEARTCLVVDLILQVVVYCSVSMLYSYCFFHAFFIFFSDKELLFY